MYEYWTDDISVYRTVTEPHVATQLWHDGEWQPINFLPMLAPIGGDTDTRRITEDEADRLRADSPNV